MSRYRIGRQNSASSSDSSRFKLFIRVTFFTIILLVPVIIYVIITTLPPSPVTGRTVDRGYFDPYSTIKTEWFSFRVEKTWQEVPDITVKDKVYYYREMQGANPQGLLAVHVNGSYPVVSESYYSNAVPVKLSDDVSSLFPDDLLPHCDTVNNPKVTVNHTTTQGDTTFTCWAGTPLLYAVAGEIGGNEKLMLKRTDGTTAQYVITYRNLAFSPNPNTFTNVLSTFKSL